MTEQAARDSIRGLMVGVESGITGGLLGVAAGDALGATVEFMSPSEIRHRFGVHREITGGGAFDWLPGEGTDDTDLTWAVLSAYLDGPYTLQRVAGQHGGVVRLESEGRRWGNVAGLEPARANGRSSQEWEHR